MRPAIRPTTPDDAAALARFLAEAFELPISHPIVDERQLHWKYWSDDSDWDAAKSFVLARGAEILGHAGLIPGTMLIDSGTIRVAHVIDWAARPGALGAGGVLMAHVRRLADALLGIGGTQQTLAILPVLGFRAVATAIGSVRPLHPVQRWRREARRGWRRAAQFARSAWWAASAPARPVLDWSLRRLDRADLAGVRLPVPAAQPGVARMVRTRGGLSHALGCPIAPMDLYLVERRGAPRGYVLLARAPGQVRLGDCWIDSSDAADWESMIELAVREARADASAAELVALTSDPLLAPRLRACGFRARTQEHVQLLMNAGRVPPPQLAIQLIDNDALYNHAGTPQFWA